MQNTIYQDSTKCQIHSIFSNIFCPLHIQKWNIRCYCSNWQRGKPHSSAEELLWHRFWSQTMGFCSQLHYLLCDYGWVFSVPQLSLLQNGVIMVPDFNKWDSVCKTPGNVPGIQWALNEWEPPLLSHYYLPKSHSKEVWPQHCTLSKEILFLAVKTAVLTC